MQTDLNRHTNLTFKGFRNVYVKIPKYQLRPCYFSNKVCFFLFNFIWISDCNVISIIRPLHGLFSFYWMLIFKIAFIKTKSTSHQFIVNSRGFTSLEGEHYWLVKSLRGSTKSWPALLFSIYNKNPGQRKIFINFQNHMNL